MVEGANAVCTFGKKSDTADEVSGGLLKAREVYSRADVNVPYSVFSNPNALVIVPMASTLDIHLETLMACGHLTSTALILGSVVRRLRSQGFTRTLKKVRQAIAFDPNLSWRSFADEFCSDVSLPRNTTNALRCFAEFSNQRQGLIVVLSENDEFRALVCREMPNLVCISTLEFVQRFCDPHGGFCTKEDFDRILSITMSASSANEATNRTTLAKTLQMRPGSMTAVKRGVLKCINSHIAFVSGTTAIVIGNDNRNRGLHGDTVEVVPLAEVPRRNTTVVEMNDVVTEEKYVPHVVVSVIKRGDLSKRQLVATLDIRDAELLSSDLKDNLNSALRKVVCVPMDERFPKVRVAIRNATSLLNKRFVISITDWPMDSMWPEGRYIRTIGKALQVSTESSAILVETQLQDHERPFPESCLKELPLSEAVEIDLASCEDFRRRRVVSIDPIGCQDIDDAMSLEDFPGLEADCYELSVHIADVTRYVKAGSNLDKEAFARATSVYLQERRLDMLPTLLCENLCSLCPKVDRYAVSAVFKVKKSTLDVEMDSVRFVRTVIHSRHALAYEQAQRLVEGKDPGVFQRNDGRGWTGKPVDAVDHGWLKSTIELLMAIAKKQQDKRQSRGAVTLEAEGEYKFDLDAELRPFEVHTSAHLDIHDTVAEIMILANEAAARVTYARAPRRALLRYHPQAEESRFKACIDLAKAFGIEFRADNNKAVSESLQRVRSNCDQATVKIIESLATRAMSEAKYVCAGAIDEFTVQSEKPLSEFYHFGLGLDFYTHFTSPIRRYADVLVARLLLEYDNDPKKIFESSVEKELFSTDPPKADVTANQVPEKLIETSKFSLFAQQLAEDDSDEDEGGFAAWAKPKTQEASINPEPIVENSSSSNQPDSKSQSNHVVSKHTGNSDEDATGLIHTSSKSVQEAAEHINARHRAAKEASAHSQALFFSLYFYDSPQTVSAVVLNIRSDGLICFVPNFDIRVPVRLLRKGIVLKDALVADENHTLSEVEIKEDSYAKLQVLSNDGKRESFEFRILEPIVIRISCNMANEGEFPDAKIPPLVAAVELFSSASNETVTGKNLVMSSVMHRQTQDMKVQDGSAITISLPRSSLYAVEKKELLSSDPFSAQDRGKSGDLVRRRRLFGGYQRRKEDISNAWRKNTDSEYDDDDFRPTQSKSLAMSATELKRMEMLASARIAKLQAQKYESRVKRRMKKGE